MLNSTLRSLLFWMVLVVAGLLIWNFATRYETGQHTLTFSEFMSAVEVPRFAPPSTVPTFERTTLYLARAFRRHLGEMLDDFGSWECVGRELEAVWKADDQAKASGVQGAEPLRRD